MAEKTVAIIPVRTGSKRLPGKNIRDFHGVPMFVRTARTVKQSDVFDELIISTESDEVRQIAGEHGFEIESLRPERLATDEARLIDLCEYYLDDCSLKRDFDIFSLILATNPLLKTEHLQGGWETIQRDGTRGVVSVKPYPKSPFFMLTTNQEGELVRFMEESLGKRHEEFEQAYMDAGSFYFYDIESFLEHLVWIYPGVEPYELGRDESVDIDTPLDLELADFFFQQRDQTT